jgi:two-component system, NarL family, sensor histidine kinase DesK
MAKALLTAARRGSGRAAPLPAGPPPVVPSDSYHAPDSVHGTDMTTAPARHGDGPRAGPAAVQPARQVLAGTGIVTGRWRRYGWALAAIWLIYLAQPAGLLWHDPDLVRRYAGLATLLAFGLVFALTFSLSQRLRMRGERMPPAAQAGFAGAAAALAALAYLTVGQSATSLFIYLAVMVVFLFRSRVGWTMVAVILAASLAIPGLIPGWQVSLPTTFQIFVAALAMWGVAQLIQRNAQLAAAREEIARLVRAEERNRFARDLHDILGHSLTVVAVKAELAGRLARTSPERAEAEIADVETIAREALADVRRAAAGYREVTLAGELASAQTALTAAGIEADLPVCPAQAAHEQQEIFGWAIREGVTNVVRHSGASRCSILLTSHQVEIADDGTGPACPGGPGGGHGLAGLRERAAAVGGSVSVGRSAAGGFALRVSVP